MEKISTKKIGNEGENRACDFLLQNGYEIIERNWRTKSGEIDIIAKDKNELVFIEVKTRTNRNYGEPIDAITYYKKKHMLKSIQFYLYLRRLENNFIRIDVIEVYQRKDGFWVNHIKKAITG